MLYSWDRLNKIGPIKNNRLSVQIETIHNGLHSFILRADDFGHRIYVRGPEHLILHLLKTERVFSPWIRNQCWWHRYSASYARIPFQIGEYHESGQAVYQSTCLCQAASIIRYPVQRPISYIPSEH